MLCWVIVWLCTRCTATHTDTLSDLRSQLLSLAILTSPTTNPSSLSSNKFALEGVSKVPNEDKSAQNRLLPCVRILPRLMRSLKRHQDISLRGLLGAWLWNSEIFINSLLLPIKSIICGQSVGGGTALLVLLQLQNSAVRLMRCSTP